MVKMQYKIGVMGKAGRSRELPDVLIRNSKIIGKEIAGNGCILITGACMGVPDIAAKAAAKEGGLVLGYSPAKDLKGHIEPPLSYPRPAEKEIPIFTGYGKVSRNVLSVSECDGVIFIGGGIGTLNEFSIAYHEGKVIGVLEGVDGIVGKILKIEGDFNKNTGKYFGATIIKDKNSKRLIEKVIGEIKKREEKPRVEIPITFKNEKGKQLVGILHLPEKAKPPVVIICHGFQNTKTDRKYIKLARYLQKEGVLVFRFDFEGCGDSEGSPRDLTVAREVSDLDCALKAVAKECDIDSRRVSFVCGSLGAVITSLFVANYKISAKTLVFWSQAFNQRDLFKIWHEKTNLAKLIKDGWMAAGEKEIGRGYYLENKDKDYSDVLDKIKAPILLVQGEEDKDVPPLFSKRLAESHKNIALKILSGANHKFDDFYSQEKLIKLTVDWLKRYL